MILFFLVKRKLS